MDERSRRSVCVLLLSDWLVILYTGGYLFSSRVVCSAQIGEACRVAENTCFY